MNFDTVASAAGVVLIVVGFAMLFVPGLAGLFSANELFLSLVGVGFALQTARVVNGRRKTPYEQGETDDPEVAQDLPTPGDDFDDLMEAAGRARHSSRERELVRDRLHAAAVAVLVRTEGVSREEAIERIDAGTWTDDPYAAAFFTGSVEGTSFVQRVSLFDGSRSQFERWSTAAARAIVEQSEEADQ
ncbi:hypothetical protein G9C85_11410 [Halorubellus sp. JP-L1]|uniref:DUF7269 family protein n=1 Tax=Halorubellus sp. JP-L1 TaxID=2715753 RepID=UPI00140E20BE|nr:hypothetical protein [Halorubellus sp. JP-L1]NHN42228.1 hypothetical protein [Halorubellus sp. JP-L1]